MMLVVPACAGQRASGAVVRRDMFNDKAIAWTGPELWLDLTNAVLGLGAVAFFVVLGYVIAEELRDRRHARLHA